MVYLTMMKIVNVYMKGVEFKVISPEQTNN